MHCTFIHEWKLERADIEISNAIIAWLAAYAFHQ